jgi:hypothetical protein
MVKQYEVLMLNHNENKSSVLNSDAQRQTSNDF